MDLDIELIVTSLTAELVAEGELKEFRALRRNHERVEWILRHRSMFQKAFGDRSRERLTRSEAGKSAERAKAFRLEGNKLFSAKRFTDSVSKYNQAILLAPSTTSRAATTLASGTSGGCTIGETMKESENQLALALANRSAALLHLKGYREALRDIQEALNHGYPTSTAYKLLERRARCYHGLGHNAEALTASEAAIEEFKKHWNDTSRANKPQPVSGVLNHCKIDNERVTLEEMKNESNNSERKKDLQHVSDNVNNFTSFGRSKENEGFNSDELNNDKTFQSLIKLQYQLKSIKSKTGEDTLSGVTMENQHQDEFFKHSVSNSLFDIMDLRYSEQAGRYTISLCDIEPGRALSVEFSTAGILCSEFAKTHCYNCMKLVSLIYPCSHCSDVIFCSPECCQDAWEKFHRYDCGTNMCKNTETISKQAALAFRMLLVGGFKIVTDIFSGDVSTEKKTQKLVSMETSYLNMVTTMIGHEEAERSDAVQLSMLATAYYLLTLSEIVFSTAACKATHQANLDDLPTAVADRRYQTSPGFEQNSEKVDKKIPETNNISSDNNKRETSTFNSTTESNEQLIGSTKSNLRREAIETLDDGVNKTAYCEATGKPSDRSADIDLEFNEYAILSALLRHLQLIQCNAFVVSDMTPVSRNPMKQSPQNAESPSGILASWRLRDVGLAMYPAHALVNHSCDPNVDLMFDGCRATLRTIKQINAGDEILIDYGQTFITHSKTSRRAYLSKHYFFECQCIACLNDWPLSNDLPHLRPLLRCSVCKNGILNEGGICDGCGGIKGRKELVDIAERLAQSHDEFKEAASRAVAGHLEDAIPVLSRHLTNMQELLALPWREFYSCQAILRQCCRIFIGKRALNSTCKYVGKVPC